MDHLPTENRHPWSVFLIFLRLGLTSFGGPIAHLGYFRDEFVIRRRWLSERSYADLVALCQFLPGPASSQVGIALGLSRSGYIGAFAAWAGFTLPSAALLIIFALSLTHLDNSAAQAGALRGLEAVAIAVVAQAVWGMARHFCNSTLRIAMMLAAALAVLLIPSVWLQIGVIFIAGISGLFLFKPVPNNRHDSLNIRVRHRTGTFCLVLFVALLFILPVLARLKPNQNIAMVDTFYRTGSLVFGGGHVVLPLLQTELIPRGWLSNEMFMTGYGAAQAVPGPLFTFAAFLGTAINTESFGWTSGIMCLIAIFAPSFLLVIGVLPFWERLRQNTRMQAALFGVNAAVVGLLLAALYQQVEASISHPPQYLGLTLLAFIALMVLRLPPWSIVISSSAIGYLFSIIF